MTVLFCLQIALVAVTPGMAERKQVQKQFHVEKDGLLTLYSDKGSVSVRSQKSLNVEVVATLTAEGFRGNDAIENFIVTLEERAGDVQVRGEWSDRSFRRHNRLRVHYEIVVPMNYNLNIETSGGSIEVGDLNGRVDLHTSGGPISVGEISGTVDLKTSGGPVSLVRCGHDATVETSGGAIRIGEVNGSIKARTSGGSITLRGAEGDVDAITSGGGLKLKRIAGNLRGRTSGGSITAELLNQIDSDLELQTSGGSIDLIVPDNFKGDLDARTSGGRIRTDLPILVRGTTGLVSKRSLRGQMNGGGQRIRLRTSGGNIEIRER